MASNSPAASPAPEQTYKIASIPADGVGKEVVAAGRKVLDFVAEQSERQVRLPVGRLRLGQRVLRRGPAG